MEVCSLDIYGMVSVMVYEAKMIKVQYFCLEIRNITVNFLTARWYRKKW